MRIVAGLLWPVLVLCATAADRQVAITIDDLPSAGSGGASGIDAVRRMTVKLLAPFREQKIPLIGFVNAGQSESLGAAGVREMLDLWLAAGADLGNHTYSHPNIDTSPFEEYTADIVKGEPLLREALAARGKKLEFFRHPFLHTGERPK